MGTRSQESGSEGRLRVRFPHARPQFMARCSPPDRFRPSWWCFLWVTFECAVARGCETSGFGADADPCDWVGKNKGT